MEHFDYAARIERVRGRLDDLELDTFMVTAAENRRYLSGYTAEDTQCDETAGALFITRDRLVLATDSRFELQAEKEAPDFERFVYKKGLEKELPEILSMLDTRRMGFESVRLSVKQLKDIRSALEEKGLAVSVEPTAEVVESLRVRKTEAEIDAIRKALRLAETAFDRFRRSIAMESTEAEIAWALERALRESGADGLSFAIIAAAGPNAALPHAVPGDRKIAAGQPLLFDWGVRLGGYCSDISRTVCTGPPDDTFQQVFDTVHEAQLKAIEAIRPGVSGKSVDRAARDHIEKSPFAGRFGHGLGHGVGLAVHEAPRLSPVRDDILEAGMVVTVEPGIYLPRWGGVRLENLVAVRQDGAEVLNAMPVRLPHVGLMR